MHLDVLFQVSGSCKGFAALVANKGLLLGVYASVPVAIGLLIKSLLTLIKVALVRFEATVCHFVALEARLNGKFFFALAEFAFEYLF